MRPQLYEAGRPFEVLSEASKQFPPSARGSVANLPKALGTSHQMFEHGIAHREAPRIPRELRQHRLIRAPFAAWVRVGGQGRVLEEAEDLLVAELVGLVGFH